MTKIKKPSLPAGVQLHRLNHDLTSDEYHSIEGTYSSTQFKDLLSDEELFIKKYIEKTVQKEDSPAFSTGNYFHTGVLEPHKLKKEYAVYPGAVRRGNKWDKFQKVNKGRINITSSQVNQAKLLMELVKNSPISMSYIKRGKPEVSLFVELHIYNGEIYANKYEKKLTRDGWVDCIRLKQKEINKSVVIVVKVRADSLGDDFVLDLKSTTGNAKSQQAMEEKILYYNYDLSCSLYLDLFTLESVKPIRDFIWTFASKDFHNCKSYRATPDNIQIGRIKWMKAVVKLADLIRSEFALYDELGQLGPHFSQKYYLVQNEYDDL